MATLQTFTHDPDAILDYSVDWSAWLVGADTITASTWSISPAGPSLTGEAINIAGTIATVFVSGATSGSRYTLTNHITTTDGREDDRSITIKVAER